MKTHVAPVVALSVFPPTIAVLPLADSATEWPCWAAPTAPLPTSFAPCWLHTPPLRVKTHVAPADAVVGKPADDRGVAVARQRDRVALLGGSHSAAADQLRALLAPHPAAAGEDPRRSGAAVVAGPAHDRGVAVGGQRDRIALLGGSHSAAADELRALLAPHPAAAGEDPRRSGAAVVGVPAHDRGVAVGGQRDRIALHGGSHSAAADQLRALLAPHPAAAGEDPRRSGVRRCRHTRRRSRCCRRRTARPNSLAGRLPQRRCRPASGPAGSTPRRCG